MKKVAFLILLMLVILITGGALLVYATVQQNYRQSANDPQIQLAEDLALAIKNQTSQCNHLGPIVDITKTLAPFYSTFNGDGQSQISTNNLASCFAGELGTLPAGLLNDHAITLPSGVFDFARAHTQDRFTWQPEPGQRFAAVVVYYRDPRRGSHSFDQFVLVARSLKEVEIRESQLAHKVLTAWLLGILITTVSFLFAAQIGKSRLLS